MGNIIYMLVKLVHGPHGHGEPGSPYLAIHEDGNGYSIGNPSPVFVNLEDAEKFKKENDKYNSFEIMRIPIIGDFNGHWSIRRRFP